MVIETPLPGEDCTSASLANLEHFHLMDESGKVRNVKYKLIEERYVDPTEIRCIYSGHEAFQYSLVPQKLKLVREGRVSRVVDGGCLFPP